MIKDRDNTSISTDQITISSPIKKCKIINFIIVICFLKKFKFSNELIYKQFYTILTTHILQR